VIQEGWSGEAVSPKWLVKNEVVKVVFRLGTIQVILRTTCRGREWREEERERKRERERERERERKREEKARRVEEEEEEEEGEEDSESS